MLEMFKLWVKYHIFGIEGEDISATIVINQFTICNKMAYSSHYLLVNIIYIMITYLYF